MSSALQRPRRPPKRVLGRRAAACGLRVRARAREARRGRGGVRLRQTLCAGLGRATPRRRSPPAAPLPPRLRSRRAQLAWRRAAAALAHVCRARRPGNAGAAACATAARAPCCCLSSARRRRSFIPPAHGAHTRLLPRVRSASQHSAPVFRSLGSVVDGRYFNACYNRRGSLAHPAARSYTLPARPRRPPHTSFPRKSDASARIRAGAALACLRAAACVLFRRCCCRFVRFVIPPLLLHSPSGMPTAPTRMPECGAPASAASPLATRGASSVALSSSSSAATSSESFRK